MAQSAQQLAEQAERDARVVELHARGMSFRQIAALGIEGVSSASQAHTCFHRAMKEVKAIPAEEYRKLENDKLDNLERRANGILMDEAASTTEKIRTMQVLVSAYKRRADLNGLDAPVQIGLQEGIQTVFVDTRVLHKTITEPDA